MEEITTRFEIVRLAVKMADHETVSVQAKKLRDLSLDEDLNEIIALLESRNYRQALFLMKGYVSSLDDSFFSEPPVAAPAPKRRKTQQAAAETQSLFDMTQPQVNRTINLDDMLRMTEEGAGESVTHPETDYVAESYIAEAKEEVQKNEAYLDMHKNRAENKTIKPFETSREELLSDMDGNRVEHVSVSEVSETKESESPSPASKERAEEKLPEAETEAKTVDTAVQKEESTKEESGGFKEAVAAAIEEEAENFEVSTLQSGAVSLDTQEKRDVSVAEEIQDMTDTASAEAVSTEHAETREEDRHQEPEAEASLSSVSPVVEELDTLQKYSIASDKEENELKTKRKEDYTRENRRYSPISYIDQKFRNMRHQFPQVEEGENGIIDEVKLLLKQMATEGYTENDIRDAIRFFQEKKAEGYRAEAAQMLLLAAASESKYAQLLLARELFKGEVLKADYPESFTQINRLAEHDYPEAICDLAQLYEYGYGIKKDKKTALLLYEEAAEMGVERARKHVARLSSKKGILSAFFK